VGTHARHDVVSALVKLAASTSYSDRADAGRALAGFAESPPARRLLVALLLDADDTFVTRETAEVLLRRRDAVGLATVASALAVADFGQTTQIVDAVFEVYGIYADQRDAAVRVCGELLDEADESQRQGVTQLRDALLRVNPVLHPA
jgi:hypothetical protein